MEITYTLMMQDILRFNGFLNRRRPARRLGLLLRILVVPGVWIVLLSLLPGASSGALFIWGVGLVLLLAWIPTLLWTTRRVLIRQNARALGLVTVRLLRDGLFVAGELTETKYRWRGVGDVVDAPQDLYFFISPLMAVIVPKSAFGEGERVEVFAAQARALWASGGEGEVPPPPESRETWPPPPQRLAQRLEGDADDPAGR